MNGLTFVAAACSCRVSDPCRPNVREAIEKLRLAGIQIAMVTGDSALTTKAIAAADVGIISADTKVKMYTGEQLNSSIDEEIGQKAKHRFYW